MCYRKHNNPCGVALAARQVDAYTDALASDPESAFGSIICFNEIVTLDTAEAMADLFNEVLIAPGYTPEAKEFIMQKGNRRLLTIDSPNNRLAPLERKRVLKQIEGGWIVQTEEAPIIDWNSAKTVTEKSVTDAEIDSMKFAVRVCEQVKSNAIVMVQGLATVGIGPGQTSRVEAVRIAARRAGERANGCVLASDAFFPFADGLNRQHKQVLPLLFSQEVQSEIRKSLMPQIDSESPCSLLVIDCSAIEAGIGDWRLLHVVLTCRRTMSDHVIAVLPGDGTGKEVAVEAQRILDTIQEHTNHGFEQTVIPCGGQHYLATGEEWAEVRLNSVEMMQMLFSWGLLVTWSETTKR